MKLEDRLLTSIASQVRVPKTAELVANHLRDQIITNAIPEGDSLPNEAEMVEKYKVSRPTLREAFRILESEGLLSISRGTRGARVRLPEIDVVSRRLSAVLRARQVKLDDVYRARMLIEPPAARLVAERKNPGDVAMLREIVERGRASLDDHEAFGVSSNAFHRTLVQLSGVQTLGLIIDMLNDMLERHLLTLYMAGADSADSLVSRRKSLKAQEKLVSKLEEGDPQAAETYWREHLTAVGKTLARLDRIDQDIRVDHF